MRRADNTESRPKQWRRSDRSFDSRARGARALHVTRARVTSGTRSRVHVVCTGAECESSDEGSSSCRPTAHLLGRALLRSSTSVGEKVRRCAVRCVRPCSELARFCRHVTGRFFEQARRSSSLNAPSWQPAPHGPMRWARGCSTHSGGGPGPCRAWAGALESAPACAKVAHSSAFDSQAQPGALCGGAVLEARERV